MADDAAARRAASAGAPEAQKTFAKACANSLEWHYKAAQRRGAPPSRPTILESDSKRPGWYEPPDATAAPPRVERRAEATDMQNQIDAVEFGLKQLRASADEPPDASVLERLTTAVTSLQKEMKTTLTGGQLAVATMSDEDFRQAR
ncbi:RNA polymerase II transcription regulator recruiting protein [Aureococcus anophagefferens]|nr:RNA polymerase II transcription regulator recruiting protein [Aureococcus anophagefferens]